MVKTKKMIVLIILLIFILFVLWLVWSNKTLAVTKITVTSDKLPQSFSGFRIAQISDLHNAEFGKDNEALIKKLKNTNPDIIVITGDFADSRNTDFEICLNLAKQALKIAPVYYVTGNHEARIDEYDELKDGLKKEGVFVLENESVLIERNGEQIALLGISDPSFGDGYNLHGAAYVTENVLESLKISDEFYTVLLSHRPELFKVYADFGIDLVFCGHAHGGQVRIPFVGGILAPGQGFIPKYDSGIYKMGSTDMIVSRGIGNSIVPVRINNRPEIVLAELKCE